MAKKAASGAGTIRKKTVIRNGKQYTYWEARFTTGFDPGTGKQLQRSITGKTQKEVSQKLKAATTSVDTGSYIAPSRMSVGQWLDIWAAEYLVSVKPNTVRVYTLNIKKHIKPAIGAIKLSELRPHTVQKFINDMELSPASIRLAYKVLHQALEKAVKLDYILKNPAAGCELPRSEQKEIRPLDDHQTAALLKAAKGGDMEHLITVALFTGIRLSELLGLTWDAIDFNKGIISVNKQLARPDHRAETPFLSPKNGKGRIITPALSVLASLKQQKHGQMKMQLKAGEMWDNQYGLVFTTQTGEAIDQWKIEKNFHHILVCAGLQGIRFHDLRHTYAVNSIRAGDDIKTIQGNLGHSSAAFTLDRYGHFTEQMRQDSAARMEKFMNRVLPIQ